MKKVFLDSDIILDALLKRPGFYLPAINILDLAHQSYFKAVTSSIAFINVHYFLNKFNADIAIQSLTKLRLFISILEVNEKTIDIALKSEFKDFEDAVQYYAAKSAGADVIITRNTKDYKESIIPVLTPEQFLRTL